MSDLSDLDTLELRSLPRPNFNIEIQNLDLWLNSDDVLMFSSFMDDYFPDDVTSPSSLTVMVKETKIALLDVASYEARSLEAFRLVSPEESSTQNFYLDGLKIYKDGRKIRFETIASSNAVSSSKQDEIIDRLENELVASREKVLRRERELTEALEKLKLSQGREQTLLDALDQKHYTDVSPQRVISNSAALSKACEGHPESYKGDQTEKDSIVNRNVPSDFDCSLKSDSNTIRKEIRREEGVNMTSMLQQLTNQDSNVINKDLALD